MHTRKKILLVCPEEKGGIYTYTQKYHSYLKNSEFEMLPPFFKLSRKSYEDLFKVIESQKPDLIHFQHEYGMWGSKIPPFYFFPELIKQIRKKYPSIMLVATAHTVLNQKEIWMKGKGIIPKWILNNVLAKSLSKMWNEETWGKLDGVIVHSKLQVDFVKKSGCKNVVEIGVYIPQVKSSDHHKLHPLLNNLETKKKLVVFGYFSKDKGQDVVVKALKLLPSEYILILAGGVRLAKDKSYFNKVKKLCEELEVKERVIITGYLEEIFLGGIYALADLVIVPFRWTSGSASLTEAIARNKPVVASDLPLNVEISERGNGCFELFKTENPQSLATVVQSLMNNPGRVAHLTAHVKKYAEKYSIDKTTQQHLEFYKAILDGFHSGPL